MSRRDDDDVSMPSLGTFQVEVGYDEVAEVDEVEELTARVALLEHELRKRNEKIETLKTEIFVRDQKILVQEAIILNYESKMGVVELQVDGVDKVDAKASITVIKSGAIREEVSCDA